MDTTWRRQSRPCPLRLRPRRPQAERRSPGGVERQFTVDRAGKETRIRPRLRPWWSPWLFGALYQARMTAPSAATSSKAGGGPAGVRPCIVVCSSIVSFSGVGSQRRCDTCLGQRGSVPPRRGSGGIDPGVVKGASGWSACSRRSVKPPTVALPSPSPTASRSAAPILCRSPATTDL